MGTTEGETKSRGRGYSGDRKGARVTHTGQQASARTQRFQRTALGYFAENESYTVNLFFMTINHICIYKH